MQVAQIEQCPSSPSDIDHGLFSPGNASSISTRFSRSPNELVAAFRAGSSIAFEEVQKLYSKRLYNQIVSITRSHEDAEDALQDTFLRAFLARDSFEGRSHLCTWLTRINARGWLIEEQDAWLMHDGGTQRDALLPSSGQAAG